MTTTISNEELIGELVELVRIEKDATIKILEHLAEVDRRRLWLEEGYSSLFDFCLRRLKYSEGEAVRRIQAARTLVKFVEVKPILEKQELSLTGLCLIAPHLTPSNIDQVLGQTKNKSTREVERVVKRTFPEVNRSETTLKIILDPELERLWAEAQQLAADSKPELVLRKILRDYLRPRQIRKSLVKRHTRYVPHSVRSEVLKRDRFKCSYSGPRGVICNQTKNLHVDHIRPWAKGGSSHEAANLRVLCRAHNLMKAKLDFPSTSTQGMLRLSDL